MSTMTEISETPLQEEQENASDVSILISDKAAVRVAELMKEAGSDTLKLRVYITGGGCSGYQYGFTFQEEVRPDDTVIEKSVFLMDKEKGKISMNIQVVIDVVSIMYLNGALIDYVESLQGAYFRISNPNAVTTCSCGSSFSL